MIRTLLIRRVKPAQVDIVISHYHMQQVLQYSLDNSDAIASEISRAVDGSGEILVTGLWPDADAYQR